MSDREYADLVRRMREAQREFFKFRMEAVKLRAMSLERDVDRETARRLAPPTTPSMFDAMPMPEDTL